MFHITTAVYLFFAGKYGHACYSSVPYDSFQEGFLSNVGSLKGVQHVVLLSQVHLYLCACLFGRGDGALPAQTDKYSLLRFN